MKYFIEVPVYKDAWLVKLETTQTWVGNSISGLLALLTFACIIGVVVKR
jgi:hypothetical protein